MKSVLNDKEALKAGMAISFYFLLNVHIARFEKKGSSKKISKIISQRAFNKENFCFSGQTVLQ